MRWPRTDFFLRAESLFTAATYAEPVRLTQSFLEARERFLQQLFSD